VAAPVTPTAARCKCGWLGREPTIEEIAEAMSHGQEVVVTPEKVREIIKASQHALSLDRPNALFGYLALVNGLLGAFNLVPGFPLDGGRVLRAIVWDVTGDARRALEVAVTVGQIVGYGFMVGGLVWAISGELLSGIWIAAIGWFLQGTGAASLQSVPIEQSLGDVRVRDILRADTTTIPADASVAELIDDYLLPGNRRALPVTAPGERLVGIVTRADIVRQFQLREVLHLGRGRA
jgi:CBS domain-containing protein